MPRFVTATALAIGLSVWASASIQTDPFRDLAPQGAKLVQATRYTRTADGVTVERWDALAAAFVQQANNGGTPDADPGNVTLGASVTATNFVVAGVSFTEASGNAVFTMTGETVDGTHNQGWHAAEKRLNVAWICGAAGGQTVGTWTLSTETFEAMIVAEYSGIDTSASCVADSDSGSVDSQATPYTSATITGGASSLIVCFGTSNRELAPNAGETERGQAGNSFFLTLMDETDADGTDTCQWDVATGSGVVGHAILAALESGAAPASPLPALIAPRGGGDVLAAWWRLVWDVLR